MAASYDFIVVGAGSAVWDPAAGHRGLADITNPRWLLRWMTRRTGRFASCSKHGRDRLPEPASSNLQRRFDTLQGL